MIYFTADTHYYHSSIIKICGRPCKGVTHMNNCLIDNYNKVVTKDDEVYFLGDFAWKASKSQVESIVSRLMELSILF